MGTESTREEFFLKKIPYHYCQLKNGLEVYLFEKRGVPLFHAQTWISVGSWDEKLDSQLRCTGLAHFFEHLMFRGSEKYPDGAFDKILTSLGAEEVNASTGFDRTQFHLSLPLEAFESFLELESDRLSNLKINSKVFEIEKKAVLNECDMYLDDPDTVLMESLYRLAFPDHPYGDPVIGTRKEIENFSLSQAQYFYENYYTAKRISLILIGDLDPDFAFQKVGEAFCALRADSCPRPEHSAWYPQTNEKKIQITHSQLVDKKLLVGFRVPPVSHPDYPALWVLQAIFGSGDSAILQRRWVEKLGAYHADVDLDELRGPGLFMFQADFDEEVSENDLLEDLEKIFLALKFEDDSASDEFIRFHLERAKNQLRLELWQSFEDNASMGNLLGELLMGSQSMEKVFELIEALSSVGPQDIQRVIQRYFQKHQRSIVLGEG
jgi:zinc protease